MVEGFAQSRPNAGEQHLVKHVLGFSTFMPVVLLPTAHILNFELPFLGTIALFGAIFLSMVDIIPVTGVGVHFLPTLGAPK